MRTGSKAHIPKEREAVVIKYHDLKSMSVLADFETMKLLLSFKFYTSRHEMCKVLAWTESDPVCPMLLVREANWLGCKAPAESEAVRLGVPFVRYARMLDHHDLTSLKTGDTLYACGVVDGTHFAGEVGATYPTNSVSMMVSPRTVWQGFARVGQLYPISLFNLYRPQ